MNELTDTLKQPLVQLLLALADDKLMLGHRNSDWTGLGPILEEDIAFSHLAQDEMAHAQAIYEFAGRLVDQTADELAFGRTIEQYRCAAIVELPDEFDWALAMARKFYCDHFDRLRLARLANSSHKPLADLAARLAAEEQLHVEHVDAWIVRLGAGSAESRARMQRALQALSGPAAMLFEPVESEIQLVNARLYPGDVQSMFEALRNELTSVASRANLHLDGLTSRPQGDVQRGGRRGVHTPHLGELLREMCEVWRMAPGAAW